MTLVRTPLITGEVNLSSGDQLHWKQVLPLDYKLDYSGHKLHFDEKYINEVIRAYKENALGDPVAFQLADDENRHDTPEDDAKQRNHDPARFRGSVKAMELRKNYAGAEAAKNGLWCGFSLTDAGKALIKDNSELGVSASLSQGFDPQYPVIMRHVVGTIHPKIKRMAGWEQALVSLSDVENKDEEVLDFMPEEKKEENGGKIEIDRTEWDNVMAYVKAKQEEDQEIADLLKEAEDAKDETSTSTTETKEAEKVNLSEDPQFKQMQLDLAESRNDAANEKWQRERAELSRQGVPKAMLDFAEPIMKIHGAVNINLSDGTSADQKDAMRKMLHEAKGFVDLSEEEGYGRDGNPKNEEEKKADKEYFDSVYDDFTMNGVFE